MTSVPKQFHVVPLAELPLVAKSKTETKLHERLAFFLLLLFRHLQFGYILL